MLFDTDHVELPQDHVHDLVIPGHGAGVHQRRLLASQLAPALIATIGLPT